MSFLNRSDLHKSSSILPMAFFEPLSAGKFLVARDLVIAGQQMA
jgi:hypothetical protein